MVTEFERIYGTVLGYLTPECAIAQVEDITGEGSAFDRAYQEILDARQNLCRRFGMTEDDADLERIMDALQALEKAVAQGIYNACTREK